LLLIGALLHVVLKETNGINLCDVLDLVIELLIWNLVPSDRFLNERYVWSEVKSKLLSDACYQVQYSMHIGHLVDMCLHDLEKLVNDLPNVFPKTWTFFERLYGLKHLDV